MRNADNIINSTMAIRKSLKDSRMVETSFLNIPRNIIAGIGKKWSCQRGGRREWSEVVRSVFVICVAVVSTNIYVIAQIEKSKQLFNICIQGAVEPISWNTKVGEDGHDKLLFVRQA